MNKKTFFVGLGCLLFVVNTQVYAQATAEDLSSALGFQNTVNDVPEAPIDFLISAMAVIGAIYGSRKLKQS